MPSLQMGCLLLQVVLGHSNLTERNPPGGFLFIMFPNQELGGRGPPLKNQP